LRHSRQAGSGKSARARHKITTSTAPSLHEDEDFTGASILEPSEMWRELGRQALQEGETEEAIWYLRQAVDEDGDNPASWQLLGRCFDEMGETTRARNCYTLAARQIVRSGAEAGEQFGGPLAKFWTLLQPKQVQQG